MEGTRSAFRDLMFLVVRRKQWLVLEFLKLQNLLSSAEVLENGAVEEVDVPVLKLRGKRKVRTLPKEAALLQRHRRVAAAEFAVRFEKDQSLGVLGVQADDVVL